MSRTVSLIAMARDLATARQAGVQARNADLRRLSSEQDALVVQDLADLDYGGAFRGWTLAGTSALTARLLRLDAPVAGRLVDKDLLPSGSTYRLPFGALGIGCGFGFVFGRSFPVGDDTDNDIGSAIVQVYLSLQLLGRRVPNRDPLNGWTAAADFGLDVLHVRGPACEDWRALDLSQAALSLSLDGNEVARGRGSDVMGDPLTALAWLASLRRERRSCIEAGDLVAVGSCTGLAQVVPGQTVIGGCDMLGTVRLALT